MNVLVNHCWCSDSHRGGNYDCKVIVSFNYVQEGKSYHDGPSEDWKNLIVDRDFRAISLKPEVLEWLEKEFGENFCIGSDDYNNTSGIQFSVFFQKQKDANAFIKRWSALGRTEEYLNYFLDLRKKYNPVTKTLQILN